jgi:1,2-diacylglycerol 3-alpha-glucosyltransferase
MKILICSSSYAPARNGQAVFATNLAEGLVRRGHTVWVIMPSERRTPYQSELNGVQLKAVRAMNLEFIHTETYGAAFPQAEVNRFFRTFEPDLVHLQEHHPLSVCVEKAARRLHRPIMGTNHFMPENLSPYLPLPSALKPLFNRWMWRWMIRVFNTFDLATAPSRTAGSIMRAQGVQIPIFPVSCGVDLNLFRQDGSVNRQELRQRYGLPTDQTVFLFVGRVDGEKRLDVLIRAMKILNRRDIIFTIAGRGAAMPHYQSLVRGLGVQDRVHFTGFVPAADLMPLLNSVDYFAMPSEAELLSIASLEAMACGLPLLAARARALPELVDEGANGCLFEPGNPSDAARAMALLADHPERRPALSAHSLVKVRPHSMENVLARYEELYQSAVDGAIPATVVP